MTQANNKEHELAIWLNEQEENYHPDISKSKGMLRDPECHKLYTEFINDPKYSKYLTIKQMKEAINDTLLTERCNAFTRKMLEAGMDINKVCMFVKDYQKKYLFIKREGGDYKLFTMEMWWELGQRGDGKFSLAK